MSIYMLKFLYKCPNLKINVEMKIYMSNCNIYSLLLKKYMSKSMYGSRFKLSRCNVIFDK